MIRRTLSACTIVLLLALGVPAVASAHILKVDGHIGAVLHINPDDNPTAGSSTDFVISFTDDTGGFSLPQCRCNVSILENGKTVTTQPLAASSEAVSDNHYTFVKPGVYDMRLSGTPKAPEAFQPFTLDYEVRVTGGQAAMQPMPVLLWVGMGLMIGLVLLAALAMDYGSKQTEGQSPRNS